MPIQTKSPYDFLNKVFIENQILKEMNPYLRWLDIFPKIGVSTKAVAGRMEQYSKTTDPEKRKPRRKIPGAKFPHVKISAGKSITGTLSGDSFMATIDQDIMDYPDELDEFGSILKHMAMWMAQNINTTILDHITANILIVVSGELIFDNKGCGSPNPAWNEVDAVPVQDMNLFRRDFRTRGNPLKLTDVYLPEEKYGEYTGFLLDADISLAVLKDLGGTDITNPIMTVPRLGITLHEVYADEEAIPASSMIGLTSMMNLGTIYYTTVGKHLAKAPAGMPNISGLSIKITENEEGNYELKMWNMFMLMIKYPRAGLMAEGLI